MGAKISVLGRGRQLREREGKVQGGMQDYGEGPSRGKRTSKTGGGEDPVGGAQRRWSPHVGGGGNMALWASGIQRRH